MIMNFKISPVERLIIKNSKYIRIAMLIALVLIFFAVLAGTNIPEVVIVLLYLVLGTVLALAIEYLAVRPAAALTKFLTNSLDLEETVARADALLEVYRPAQRSYIGAVTYIKSVALFDMGKVIRAKQLCEEYIEASNVKRPPYFQIFQMHGLLSSIALKNENYPEYKRQIDLAKKAYKRRPASQRKLIERNRLLTVLRNDLKIYTSEEYNEKFERTLLLPLSYTPDKRKLKGEAAPMTKLTAYSNCFKYFETLSMPEKQREYAQKIIETGNEQFETFLKAKEFLENADEDT